jgi:hypothetical protein
VADARRVDVCQRSRNLVHVKLYVEHRDDALGSAVVLDDSVDGLGNKFQDEIQINFVRLFVLRVTMTKPTEFFFVVLLAPWTSGQLNRMQ